MLMKLVKMYSLVVWLICVCGMRMVILENSMLFQVIIVMLSVVVVSVSSMLGNVVNVDQVRRLKFSVFSRFEMVSMCSVGMLWLMQWF